MLLPVLHLLISRFIEPLDAAIRSSYVAFVFCRTDGRVYPFFLHFIRAFETRSACLSVLHTFHSRFIEPVDVAISSSFVDYKDYRTNRYIPHSSAPAILRYMTRTVKY